MVASTLFLSVLVLGVPAVGQRATSVGLSHAENEAARSHLVVPTGIAVPVEGRDARPAPSDLFRMQPSDADLAIVVVDTRRPRVPAGTL